MNRKQYKKKYGLLAQCNALIAKLICLLTHTPYLEYYKGGSSYTGYTIETICRKCHSNYREYIKVLGCGNSL